MKLVTSLFVFAVLLVGLGAENARAQSCNALLGDLVNHASTPLGGGENYVTFKMVGNRGGSDWAQFTEGELHYHPAVFTGWYFIPARFGGDAKQSFSDRIWSEPPPQGGLFGTPHPFNPYAKDDLRVSFNINGWSSDYGKLTYTLLSWGNASATVDTQCQGDYLYAFLNDQMLVFTFKKVSFVYPK